MAIWTRLALCRNAARVGIHVAQAELRGRVALWNEFLREIVGIFLEDTPQRIAELEQSRKQVDAAQRQAQSLHDWRNDYQNRWQAQFRQAGGVEIMRCYQDFMQRLGSAVSDQDVKVAQALAQQQRCQATLLERERKVAAISQLLERRQ